MGGIVVLYLFVVMLVNLKRPPEARLDPRRRDRLGLGPVGDWCWASWRPSSTWGYAVPTAARRGRGAGAPVTERGADRDGSLYTDYLIPFEVASMLLLVAMIGAIVLAKREL